MFSHLALLGDLDTPALLIILAIVLLIFGGKKLPELSRSLGSSIKEIRKGLSESGDEKQKEAAKNASEQETS